MSCFKAASVFWGNKGFSFIYGNDILKNLKGWPSFTKGYAEYVYIFCFDRIFFVLDRNIYNYFRTNLQLCKVVSGRKKRLCGTQISMRILLFKQNIGASMCTVSFTKEWILWSHSHYMMHECKPQYWNKPNNFVLQKWYLFRQIVVGWENEMETEFQKLIHCIVPQITFFVWMFLLIQRNILLQGKSIYILFLMKYSYSYIYKI